jgi:hypothetical protein
MTKKDKAVAQQLSIDRERKPVRGVPSPDKRKTQKNRQQERGKNKSKEEKRF